MHSSDQRFPFCAAGSGLMVSNARRQSDEHTDLMTAHTRVYWNYIFPESGRACNGQLCLRRTAKRSDAERNAEGLGRWPFAPPPRVRYRLPPRLPCAPTQYYVGGFSMTAAGQAGTTLASLEPLREKARASAHSLDAHDHGRGLGPSHLVPFGGGTGWPRLFSTPCNLTAPIPTRSRATASCCRRDTPRRFCTPRWPKRVFPVSRLMTLRQFSSELEGHPTPRIPGVDAATGSLGQGLSVGAGLALGARLQNPPRACTC